MRASRMVAAIDSTSGSIPASSKMKGKGRMREIGTELMSVFLHPRDRYEGIR